MVRAIVGTLLEVGRGKLTVEGFLSLIHIYLFNWQGYGASLSTTAERNSVFSSTSYLYFRVSDQGDCLVKVPVSFKGNYNFKDNKGTYSFTLSKAAN